MPAPTIVILAAGQGTRMCSDLSKVLHPLCGRPLVHWPIHAARAAGAGRIVVVDSAARPLDGHLPEDVVLAVQRRPHGTADALEAAVAAFGEDGAVIVLSGDVPLVTAAFVRKLMAAHAATGAAATMATMVLEEPGAYGRVLRDGAGRVNGVAEAGKPGDATPAQLAIREVNTGVFAFDARALRAALPQVGADNAQGERYLPDVLPILRAAGLGIVAHVVDDPALTLGVNDRADLAAVGAIAQARIHDDLMRSGVTIVDPASTTIDADVAIGRDTVIEPFCTLTGATLVGAHCRIGANSTLADALIGDGVTVRQSWLESCDVHDGATVGPFAYLRSGTRLRAGAKAGAFVEIGSGVRGGVDTMFVAPVTVGDGAWTAAGSVVTEDVPAGALAIARSRQTNVAGYARGAGVGQVAGRS